jgi:sigma-B regulation protein RsbU (phosphoserine phosphatase)
VLVRRLDREGYTTFTAENGIAALALLSSGVKVDAVLLDVMMPELDGYETLQCLKEHSEWRHLPVIMISALAEVDAAARCIEIGADDYLPKPLNSVLLRARLSACLERKRLREQEQEHLRSLRETQERLEQEMSEAVAYVTSLLPRPLHGRVEADWRFVPSTYLGGDALGYEPMDGGRLAFFVLDVCGHGVGAALLAATALNALRARTLPIDYGDPVAVLRALNDAFPMERHHQMYFSLWYGVYEPRDRRLCYASGGHPPALLLPPDGDACGVQRLRTPGFAIGSMSDAEYEGAVVDVPPGSVLWVFSDGAYPITGASGSMTDLDDFVALVASPSPPGTQALDHVLDGLQKVRGATHFEDDLSLLRVRFA